MAYGTKIYIVEDDLFFANLVKNQLESERFKCVKIFNSGEEFLPHMEDSPDVLVLDYQLGKTNGIDILLKVRNVNPKIRVIFLSAQEQMSVAIKALKYGAYDYFQKNDDGLMRLCHAVKRITQMNKIIRENAVFKKLQVAFIGVMSLFLLLVCYLAIYQPRIF